MSSRTFTIETVVNQDNNINATPEIIDNPAPRKVSMLIVVIAGILTVYGVLQGYVTGMRAGIGEGGRIGELIGQSIGVIVMALMAVAIFQIFKRFRNQRSRWKIYSWTIFIVCLSNLIRLAQGLSVA